MQLLLPSASDSLKVITDICYVLLQDCRFKNIKLINFTPGKKPSMPTGLYLGATVVVDNIDWKIDIWNLSANDQSQSQKMMQRFKSKLTPKQQEQILYWKHRLLIDGRVPQGASYLLYQALLINNLSSEEEILRFLKENNIVINYKNTL